MKKLFAAIFGSSQNTTTVVTGAVRGLDKLVYTDEEKADARAKTLDWFLRYLHATQPQNLARRLIALVIVCLWALLILAGVIARGLELWLLDINHQGETFSGFVFEVLANIVNAPFLMVMGFYFAAHVVRSWQNGKSK